MPPFGFDDNFVVSPWSVPVQQQEIYKPDFADNEQLKQLFGIELGKGLEPFKAGMEVFNQELPKALWASINWINDPVVIASKDAYINTLKKLQKPLDKEELLAKLLTLADEKDIHGRPLVEAKERINALKLYSEIQGFTGKIDINASTNNINNTVNNLMKIVLVKPSEVPKTIDAVPNIKSKISNEETPPVILPLKLVGGTSR